VSRIKFPESEIKSALSPCKPNGSGSHLLGKCPFCHKEDHFYVQRKTDKIDKKGKNATGNFNCKKCGEGGKLKKLLWQLDLKHLITTAVSGNIFEKLGRIEKRKKENFDDTYRKENPPFGYKRVKSHWYMEHRGIVKEQYDVYNIGTCKIMTEFRDYIFFVIRDEGENVAWVARHTKDRSWLDEENAKRKARGETKVLRYRNSTNDLSKLLFGLDEVTEETVTVIAVEGAFSKVAVDKKLKLYKNPKVKCVCTFGKSFSPTQLRRLLAKGVKRIVIMYDGDALKDIKKYLGDYSEKVEIYGTRLPHDKDPDDVSAKVLIQAIKNKKTPLNYKMTELGKI
jgi:hypothetical protein